MKKNLKKLTGIILLAVMLVFSLTACSTEKLDNPQTNTADADAWMEEEDTAEAEKKKDNKDEEKTETDKEEVSAEDEYLDVASVQDKEVDYSKYEEKKTSQNNGGSNNSPASDNVTVSDGSATDQDKYMTDPVPAGKQNPVEPGEADVDTSNQKTCYLMISCETILDNMENLTEGKETLIPSNGMIFSKRQVTFYDGESVFDILQRETRDNRIHMEYTMTPMYNSAYIEGINNLYEFDCGPDSGWMYCVNGWYPNYGVSRYAVQEGDTIEFHYTCDLGRDLGQDWMG